MQQLQQVIVAALLAGSLGVYLHILGRLVRRQPLVPYEPRFVVPWIGVDVFVLVVALLAIDVIAVRLSGARAEVRSGEVSASLLTAITAAHLAWTGLAVMYLKQRTYARSVDLGFDARRLLADARLGCLGFLAAVPPVYGSMFVISHLFPQTEHPLARLIREQPSAGTLALAAVSAVAVAPLAEELLFRVIVQGWLERTITVMAEHRGVAFARWAWPLPIVGSAASFAALHEGYERIALFILALFLGYVYRQTHRITAPLILHACVNAVAVVGLALAKG